MRHITNSQFKKQMKMIQLKNKQIELRNQLKAEKNKVRRFSSSKLKTSNIILMTAIIAVVLFSIACLYIQYTTSVEVSSTLITLWYSFWTVEIVSLAGIKVSKVFKSSKLSLDSNSNKSNEVEVDDDVESAG